jgi:signal transduction histidine kinase
LAISRVGRKADPIQPNDLNAILEDVLATFHHQLQESAIQIIRHPLPQGVPCRRNEINQVFSNLLSNAINYMGVSEQRFVEIGAAARDNEVECFIRDTGIGIGPEDQERVFNMFTRLQAVDVPGEGIGLAYVKRILRSHGGRAWVTSAKGQGSTFFFTLPMHHAAATRG